MIEPCDFCGNEQRLKDMKRICLDSTRPVGSVILCADCVNRIIEEQPQIIEFVVDAR